jgi:hypothetical protein
MPAENAAMIRLMFTRILYSIRKADDMIVETTICTSNPGGVTDQYGLRLSTTKTGTHEKRRDYFDAIRLRGLKKVKAVNIIPSPGAFIHAENLPMVRVTITNCL